MMKYSGPKDRLNAARDSSTSPEELAILASSEYVFVQEAVAANPNTPIHVLDSLVPSKLTSDNNFKIVVSLLRNPNISLQTCESLISKISSVLATITPRDYYPTQMIENLCTNQAVPLASLREILTSESFPKHLRGRVAREESRTEVLMILLNDRSETVRNKSARALKNQEEKKAELKDRPNR